MNKQIDNKAIEEMAKVIAEYGCCMNNKGFCEGDEGLECDLLCPTGEKLKTCAEKLYNAGYTQKVNENEVVISKDEYEKLKFNKTLCEAIRADKKLEVETASKEKAKEILEKIAYESEYAYCNRDTKWFERICEEYNIDINLFY